MSRAPDLPGPQALEAYLDAASALAGVPVAPDHRPGVLRFLAMAAEMAAVVEAAPWDGRHADLAPVFRLPDGDGETAPGAASGPPGQSPWRAGP